LTSSQSRKRDEIPTLAGRFPASREMAFQAPRCSIGLTSPPQASLSASPAVVLSVLVIWDVVLVPGKRKRECKLVKHATVFTQGNALPCNRSAVFRCQCATTLFSHTCQKAEMRSCGSRSFLPSPERDGYPKWCNHPEHLLPYGTSMCSIISIACSPHTVKFVASCLMVRSFFQVYSALHTPFVC
jgi:hypothetical protein